MEPFLAEAPGELGPASELETALTRPGCVGYPYEARRTDLRVVVPDGAGVPEDEEGSMGEEGGG